MNEIEQFIADNKVPIGRWGKSGVDWITENLDWFFDGITEGLRIPIEGVVDLLLAVPPFLFIILAAALAFLLQRSWALVLFTVLGLAFILNQGLWEAMIETVVLIVFATTISLAIGVPIGILATQRPWVYPALSPVLDMMQTIPTFVYLVPTLILFGLGLVPGLIATVIFAVPAPIRLTYLGISEVPKALVEAGEAFGATRWQLLRKVKLPAALPTIMAGVNQCIMLSLSMVVIAALVGASGLGKPVVRSLNQVNVPLGIESGLAIVVVAIILDRMLRQQRRTGPGAARRT
ncbi:MAG TPA: choline ABC transporter permease subunit [Alphaproteobacteria bacterium]|nr:choline ABC transporter permease subunit [Alphaproteobacteria bacterium]